MKHYSLTILAVASIFISCSENKPNIQNTAVASDTTKAVVVESESFLYEKNGDSIILNLKYATSEITGTLDFLPYEKDGTIGTLHSGKMSGDTLYAIYNSTQEGQDSECEIAFLKKNDGYIVTNEIDGGTNYQYNKDYTKGSFIDKSKIKFEGEFLRKVVK